MGTRRDRSMYTVYTANSIKVALPKSQTVNRERSKSDGLSLVFTSKHGIISLKQPQGTTANLLATIKGNSQRIRA